MHGGDGYDQHQSQDRNSQVHLPIDAALVQAAEYLLRLQGEEEERRVVGDRRNIERIVRGEGPRILAANQLGERRMCHPGIGSGHGQIKHVQVQIRFAWRFALDVVQHRLLLFQGEGRLLGQHQHRTSVHVQRAVADHDEILRAVRYAELTQRFHRLRDHAQGLARLGELPARDGDHAVRLQVLEVFAEGLDRVQIVFAKGEGSGRGRGPGVDQRHLHHVVPVAAVAHERASVADVHVHLGNLVEVVSVVSEALRA